jgi:hypothetical protein
MDALVAALLSDITQLRADIAKVSSAQRKTELTADADRMQARLTAFVPGPTDADVLKALDSIKLIVMNTANGVAKLIG